MLSPSKQYTWARAKSYFETQSLTNDVVYKLHRHTSPYWYTQYPSPALPHSFFHLNGKLYELMPGKKVRDGKIAGKGGFARVKYLFDEEGKPYTVKIDLYKGAARDKVTTPALETLISQDVGLFLNVGYRTKPSSNKRIQEKHFRYAVMEDLGTNLSTYLIYHPDLDDKTRLDLTFQACFLLYKLHAGLATKSGKPVVHRDIKPHNYLYDEKKGKLSLGDYGISQYGPIDASPAYMDGTERYLPYIDPNNDLAVQKKQLKLHEMDVFALKRSIYFPSVIKTMDKGLQHLGLTKPFAILNDKQLDAYHLRSYFETRAGDGDYHSPLLLSAISILALNNLQAYISEVTADEAQQKAIIILYFANMMSDKNYLVLLKNPARTAKIAKLLPVADLIKPTTLAYTLNNTRFFDILLGIADLRYEEKIKFVAKFNQLDIYPKEQSTPNEPEPVTPTPFNEFKKTLLEIIDIVLKQAGIEKPDRPNIPDPQADYESIKAYYHDWIKTLDEKTYAYFLILLNRELKKVPYDEARISGLSKETLQYLSACQQLTEDKILCPTPTNAPIITPAKDNPKDDKLIEARECFFVIISDAFKSALSLSSGTFYEDFVKTLISKLNECESIDTFVSTMLKMFDTSNSQQRIFLIHLNTDLHNELILKKIETLSLTAQDYINQMSDVIDQLDGAYYAKREPLISTRP